MPQNAFSDLINFLNVTIPMIHSNIAFTLASIISLPSVVGFAGRASLTTPEYNIFQLLLVSKEQSADLNLNPRSSD